MTSALSEFDVYRPTILAVARACGLLPWPPVMANVATTADATMGSYGHRLAASDERVSVSLKFESLHKTETPQLMQKPGYNTQAWVVPTASDPNRSGVDVPGLAGSWNSMTYADYRRSDTQGLSAWVDFKANEHCNLRTGYSHQTYTLVNAMAGYSWTHSGRRMSLALIGKTLTHQSYRPSPSTRGRPRERLLAFTSSF